MFVTIHQPGDGRFLAPEGGMLKLGFRPGTRSGLRGMRPKVGNMADNALIRDLFRALQRYSENTGFTFRVEVNAAESKALAAGALVERSGKAATYTIRNVGGRAVVS